MVKKMAGQALVYLKVRQGFEFVYNGGAESDEVLLKSAFDCSVSATKAPQKICFLILKINSMLKIRICWTVQLQEHPPKLISP